MNAIDRVRRIFQPNAFAPVKGCASCEKAASDRSDNDEAIYTFQFHDEHFGVMFSVQRARDIALAHLNDWQCKADTAKLAHESPPPIPLQRLDPETIERWLVCALDVNFDHALYHIPERAANSPGLVLDFSVESIPPEKRDVLTSMIGSTIPEQTMLIDGNHRAYRKLVRGESLPIYVLTAEEQRACLRGFQFGNLLPQL